MKRVTLTALFGTILGLAGCSFVQAHATIFDLNSLSTGTFAEAFIQGKSNFAVSTNGTILIFNPKEWPLLQSIYCAGHLPQSIKVLIVQTQPVHAEMAMLTVEKNERVLHFGQFALADSEIDRLQLSNEWNSVTKYCRNVGNEGQLSHASVCALGHDQFLITGGVTDQREGSSGHARNIAELYSSTTQKKISTYRLQEPRENHLSLFLPPNEVIIFGGSMTMLGRPPSIEILNLKSGSSRLLKCDLPSYVQYATAARGKPGECYLVGGITSHENLKIFKIDYLKEKVSVVATLQKARHFSASLIPSDSNAAFIPPNFLFASMGTNTDEGRNIFEHHENTAELISLPEEIP